MNCQSPTDSDPTVVWLSVDDLVESVSNVIEGQIVASTKAIYGVVQSIINVARSLDVSTVMMPYISSVNDCDAMYEKYAHHVVLHYVGGVDQLSGLDYFAIHVKFEAGEEAVKHTDSIMRSNGIPFKMIEHKNGSTTFAWVTERRSPTAYSDHKNMNKLCCAGYNESQGGASHSGSFKYLVPFVALFNQTYASPSNG